LLSFCIGRGPKPSTQMPEIKTAGSGNKSG
jgi:hypothetical protein